MASYPSRVCSSMCNKSPISPSQEWSLALFSVSSKRGSLWIRVCCYLPVWAMCEQHVLGHIHAWNVTNFFCLKHDCISYKYMHSEVMQTQCSFWDAGSREENNVSANNLFSEASERIFSENVGKELDVFLLILTHSPVRNCQVGLWRTPTSEFSLLHQPCWELSWS